MGDIIRVGVLTISDQCSTGEREDLSGPAIQAALPAEQYAVALYAVVPDDKRLIGDTLKRWSDAFRCDVILTTGGTGFSPRDVTPEATQKVLDRAAPNISQYLLLQGLADTPYAALSRGVAGVRGATLIINLPGSPSGAADGTRYLLPLLPHATSVLKGDDADHSVPKD